MRLNHFLKQPFLAKLSNSGPGRDTQGESNMQHRADFFSSRAAYNDFVSRRGAFFDSLAQ